MIDSSNWEQKLPEIKKEKDRWSSKKDRFFLYLTGTDRSGIEPFKIFSCKERRKAFDIMAKVIKLFPEEERIELNKNYRFLLLDENNSETMELYNGHLQSIPLRRRRYKKVRQ